MALQEDILKAPLLLIRLTYIYFAGSLFCVNSADWATYDSSVLRTADILFTLQRFLFSIIMRSAIYELYRYTCTIVAYILHSRINLTKIHHLVHSHQDSHKFKPIYVLFHQQ